MGKETMSLVAMTDSDIINRLILPPIFNPGQVFTPSFLSDWVAEILLEALDGIKTPKIIDPACGEGDLLGSVKGFCPDAKVFGVDIDPEVVSSASARLKGDSNFVSADALLPEQGEKADIGWSRLPIPKKLDGVIANPPWGADILHSHAELGEAGYSLAKGQYDSWDLFVELSLRLLKPDGVAAFIIPDAIFLPEHQATRQMLHEKLSILLIARLGEGVFKNVYRGTTVVLVRNSKPEKGHKIETLRLNNLWRKHVLSTRRTLADARHELRYFVKQDRFQNDTFSRWVIDAPENEKSTIKLISESGNDWTKWLVTGRGVEMSKRGRVLVCPKCASSRPAPRKNLGSTCSSCGYKASNDEFFTDTIIEPFTRIKKDWMPLVVGEDVDRYSVSIKKAIRLNVEGINYKNLDIYSKRRILVRKTGVGLKASIATDKCMTNQVVFHYFEDDLIPPPDFFLSYVLGVFSSRIMFAHHLRIGGESEWRSHPYITQKIVSRLPIPLPVEGEASWKQARQIAKEVDEVIENGQITVTKDQCIERLVAGLYRFSESDMSWVEKVISSAQDLEPMRALQAFDYGQLSPMHAS